MVSGSVSPTDVVTVEAFYQITWSQTELDPPGTYFSTNDFVGPGGSRAFLGFGDFSDLGTSFGPLTAPINADLAAGGLAAQPLFDSTFLGVPRGPDRDGSDGGQFGLGKEGVVHQNSVREGRECGGTSDGIAVKDGAFLVVILVAEGADLGLLFRLLVAAKDGRNGPREQIAHGVLLVEPLVEGAVGGAIYAIRGVVGGSGLLGLSLPRLLEAESQQPVAVQNLSSFCSYLVAPASWKRST